MENFFLLMNSVIDLWRIPSSMSMVLDMSFAVMLGVGIFYLLLPFLKEYPESPPPGSEKNIPKVVKIGQRKASKETATLKGCRNFQKNAQDAQNASWPMESPTQHCLLDSSPHSSCHSNKKLKQLPLPQLFSKLNILEDHIQQLLGSMCSEFSDSVVATDCSSRKSPRECKAVRFSSKLDTVQTLPLAKEPPQFCQDQPLSYQPVSPSLVGVTEVQEQENLSSSIPNQTPSFQCRALRKPHPNTEIGIQTSLPNINEPGQAGLNWKDITGCDIKKSQVAFDQPIDNLSKGTQPIKAIKSATILPEHYQIVHHYEDPQQEEKVINMGEQQRKHVRFLPSEELPQLHGVFQTNSSDYCKNLPELNQPAQPSIHKSKKYKWSNMVGSELTGMLLKKAKAKFDIPNTIKKDLSVSVEDLTCTSSSTPGKGLEPENPPMKTDKLSTMNIPEDLSFLDPKTQMKLESNSMQFPEKLRILPNVSKAEYYSKAARFLEKLHHQDPGGTRIETVHSARLRHSSPEVQEIQRTPSPAASHGPPKSHLDQGERYFNVQPNAFWFQEKPQQCRTIVGTGRGILKQNTSPKMSKHAPWKMSEDVVSVHPIWNATSPGPEYCAPSSGAKETIKLKVKEKTHEERPGILKSGGINSLKEESPLPVTEQTLKVVDRVNLVYNSPFELQAHINALVQNLENSVDNPSKLIIDPVNQVQEDKAESVEAFQLVGSSHSSEVLHEPNHSRLARRMSSSHRSPEEHSQHFMYSGTGNKLPSGIDAQRAWEQDQNKVKGGLGFVQIPTPAGNDYPWCYRGDGNKQQSGLADQKSSDPDQRRTKIGMGASPHGSPKGQKHSFIYTGIREKQESVVDHKVFDPHQNTKKGVGHGPLMIPKDNHPVKYRGTGVQEQSALAAQGAYDPDEMRTKRGKECSPHGSHEMHNHSPKYREIKDESQPTVNVQGVCDQHLNSQKRRMAFDYLLTPKENNHTCQHTVPGDKQLSSVADQEVRDPGQIKKHSGLDSCTYRCSEEYSILERCIIIRNKEQPGIVHKVCDPYQRIKKGLGCRQSVSPIVDHSANHREVGQKTSQLLLPKEPVTRGRPTSKS
ncbi:uncharacterized protein LOC110298308 [Mus caroli]|uniref:Uncharacterized protein LOC110298308 n=1 Tax=Mus caroli TaxID=10089 RepID=A0A6P5Q1M1_MUSCR|nr:uncharacterized protein LOC110298308 [Mus caroli]